MVIRYAYLWKSESDRGQVEGRKDRPCAVVLAIERSDTDTQVVVVPITHTKPEHGIELPTRTKARLGLDEQRSWIVTSEVNVFNWPGPDLRPTPSGEYTFGELPAKLFRAVRDEILRLGPESVARTE